MTRTHIVVDISTGQQTVVPYTTQEEADADTIKAAYDLAQVPIIAEQQRKTGLSSDADVIDLLNRAKTATNAQISNFISPIFPNVAQAKVIAAIIKAIALKL